MNSVGGARLVLVAHGSRDVRAAQSTRALVRAVAHRLARPADPTAPLGHGSTGHGGGSVGHGGSTGHGGSAGVPGQRRSGVGPAGPPVSAAFLDFASPRLPEVLAVAAGRGESAAIVVPLLLTAAYHGRVDVPADIGAARAAGSPLDVGLAKVLGPVDGAMLDGRALDLMTAALARRLDQAAVTAWRGDGGPSGARPGSRARIGAFAGAPSGALVGSGATDGPNGAQGAPDGAAAGSAGLAGAVGPAGAFAGSAGMLRGSDAILLAGAGSREAGALRTVDLVADALSAALGRPCRAGYASGGGPGVADAMAALRAGGARRIAVASYFLAPGLLHDRVAEQARAEGAIAVAAPLGAAPEIAQLVLLRAAAARIPDRVGL
jgi:sirohydrochlorin ferrochelatase